MVITYSSKCRLDAADLLIVYSDDVQHVLHTILLTEERLVVLDDGTQVLNVTYNGAENVSNVTVRWLTVDGTVIADNWLQHC